VQSVDPLFDSLDAQSVRIVPLGGLGEIGMNCLAIEQSDGIVLVDCGTSFPNDDLGIDVLRPDFSYLAERANRVVGVVLTHGHEDHIGAIPYLLSELDVPVWGPGHALGLVKRRLAEHEFELDAVDLRLTEPGQTYAVGPFRVEPISVAHSIIDATALCIQTRAGCVVHTGDFDFDPDPPDSTPTDERRLSEIGDAGVSLLLSDSTNVDTPERIGSEREVAETLESLISAAPARVIVALFASNLQRLAAIGRIAQATGRKIALLGRSLLAHVQVAHDIGRLHWPTHLMIGPEQIRSFPRDRLLILAGGTQAERPSAMYRLAQGTHRWLDVEALDTLILSSRVIPGYERAVQEMICNLLRRGVNIHTRLSDPLVHSSGHASRAEQQRMIELIRPQHFVPVHGTLHHLIQHAQVARDLGIQSVRIVENGRSILLTDSRLEHDSVIPHGKTAVAVGGNILSDDEITARAELGRNGVALVTLLLDASGKLVLPPRVTTRGVPLADERTITLRSVAARVVRTVDEVQRHGLDLEEDVRRAVRRAFAEAIGCRPVVEVHISWLGT
jgi:ribonuclease J